ncbi:hypothetical protein LEMLEM_LOCUS7792 [Lemmus lemmus]
MKNALQKYLCSLCPFQFKMTGFPDAPLQSTGMSQCQRGERAFLGLNQHDGRKVMLSSAGSESSEDIIW